MSSDGLLCCDVVDVRLGDTQASFFCGTTADALTVFFNWSKIAGILVVAEIQSARIDDRIAESLIWH